MKPHQERVLTERSDLDAKREKLIEFIGGDVYQKLDKPEQTRLCRQLQIMTDYLNILSERISAFNLPTPAKPAPSLAGSEPGTTQP